MEAEEAVEAEGRPGEGAEGTRGRRKKNVEMGRSGTGVVFASDDARCHDKWAGRLGGAVGKAWRWAALEIGVETPHEWVAKSVALCCGQTQALRWRT